MFKMYPEELTRRGSRYFGIRLELPGSQVLRNHPVWFMLVHQLMKTGIGKRTWLKQNAFFNCAHPRTCAEAGSTGKSHRRSVPYLPFYTYNIWLFRLRGVFM